MNPFDLKMIKHTVSGVNRGAFVGAGEVHGRWRGRYGEPVNAFPCGQQRYRQVACIVIVDGILMIAYITFRGQLLFAAYHAGMFPAYGCTRLFRVLVPPLHRR